MQKTLTTHPGCNPLCRACHYKDLDYPEQLRRKQEWARRQLHPWAPRLREILPAPEAERLAYRPKSWLRAQFSPGLSFGMYRSIRRDGKWEKEFVSWDACPLHVEPIQAMIPRLRAALGTSAIAGVWLGAPHLVVVSDDERDRELARRIDWASLLMPPFDRVGFHLNPQIGNRVFGHLPIEPVHGPTLPGDAPVKAFRQTAHTLLVQAREAAVGHLLAGRPDRILDLYCGTGELARMLPAGTGWIGIEQSREAARYAATLRAGEHEAFVGNVEQRLSDPRVLERIREPYALYVNPPRSGLTAEARERLSRLIAERPPRAIAYLSCSASSLARDLPAFEPLGYRVELLQPYDFFPQTEHFETLALLSRTLLQTPASSQY